MMATENLAVVTPSVSPAKAWLRALELTSSIPRNRERILSTVIEEVAARNGDAPALISGKEVLTYRTLIERSNQYARWALDQGVAKGDVVCLLMPNCPEYFAIWLGISSTGAVVSLLNTNLVGPSLTHCMRIVSPKRVIVSSDFIDSATVIEEQLESVPIIHVHGLNSLSHPRIDIAIESYSTEPLSSTERRATSIDDLALYIYTSGTTGLPKAARVSHARVMQWSHWFGGMMDVRASDRMYNCLPMYHSVGGVQVIGAMLVSGGSVVVRGKFSASQFWTDISRWDCTMLQYIGELCRYLLHSPVSVNDTDHRVRLACGNGMAPEIWDVFKDRFHIPQILEFYAATEGSVSLFNVQGKRGSIGHIPPYLSHRFSPALVAIDMESGEALRDDEGFCIKSETDQPGEALGKLSNDAANPGSRFDGYTSNEASEKKILRNVFVAGDAWFRTGDLMRKDAQGYYYFVDRLGDTFRRKGENVATTEVAEAICDFHGIQHAIVYGVAVPGVEGRVGMATIVTDGKLDKAKFREHLAACLPAYAQPVFLRIRAHADLTGTFKYSKTQLIREGYAPELTTDHLFFNTTQEFVPLDSAMYQRIQQREFRL